MLNWIADANWLYVFQTFITQIFIIGRRSKWMKDGEKGWRMERRTRRTPVTFNKFKVSLIPRVLLMGSRSDSSETLFCIFLEGILGAPMSGTGCNKPRYFLFCLLRWLAHVLLNNYSETTRRKQIPWAFGETTWNLCAPAFRYVPFPSPSPPLAKAAPFPNEKSWMLWLKAGTSKQGADSLWNCLLGTS